MRDQTSPISLTAAMSQMCTIFFFFGMASIAQILSHSYKYLEICSLSSSQNVFSCPIYSNLSKLHILVKAFFLFFFLAISSIIKYFLLILFKFFFLHLNIQR